MNKFRAQFNWHVQFRIRERKNASADSIPGFDNQN